MVSAKVMRIVLVAGAATFFLSVGEAQAQGVGRGGRQFNGVRGGTYVDPGVLGGGQVVSSGQFAADRPVLVGQQTTVLTAAQWHQLVVSQQTMSFTAAQWQQLVAGPQQNPLQIVTLPLRPIGLPQQQTILPGAPWQQQFPLFPEPHPAANGK